LTGVIFHGFIGTYTEVGKSRGIYSYSVDVNQGTIAQLSCAAVTVNPSYLACSGQYLYAVNELDSPNASLTAFRIEEHKLIRLDQRASGGSGPCHVAVDPLQRYIVVSHYGDGVVSVFPLEQHGKLGESVQRIVLDGQGPNRERQESAHAHSCSFAPTGCAVVCDLGSDSLIFYHGFPLCECGRYRTEPGSGPRHSYWHNGNVYVANELDSTVDFFRFDSSTDTVTHVQRYATLPHGVSRTTNTAAAIKGSKTHLYVSNRGHDSIALFNIHTDGTLDLCTCVSSHGVCPRDIELEPSGNFLCVANQYSDNLALFRIDPYNGTLSFIHSINVFSPVCLCFAQYSFLKFPL
jgi:6-phosphogluconolactonase